MNGLRQINRRCSFIRKRENESFSVELISVGEREFLRSVDLISINERQKNRDKFSAH